MKPEDYKKGADVIITAKSHFGRHAVLTGMVDNKCSVSVADGASHLVFAPEELELVE